MESKIKRIEDVYRALVQLMLSKQDPFVREIVYWMKEDEEFFQEFMRVVEKERRKVLLSALRRILIESSEKVCLS